MKPDSAIMNFYHPGDTLSFHTDELEWDLSKPLVSISLGMRAFQIYFLGMRAFQIYFLGMRAFQIYFLGMRAFQIYFLGMRAFQISFLGMRDFQIYFLARSGKNLPEQALILILTRYKIRIRPRGAK